MKWQELSRDDRAALLESIDPDWTDHWIDIETGLLFYSEFDGETVNKAIKEMQQ